MRKKTRVGLIGACATIAVCTTVMAGATYAILYQTDNSNSLTITAGNIAISAKYGDLKVESPKTISVDYDGSDKLDYDEVTTPNKDGYYNFNNGGYATIQDHAIVISNMTPADKVNFSINITNDSPINIKYRLRFEVTSGNELMSLLNFKMSSKDSDLAKVYGDTKYIDSYIASADKTTYNYKGIQYFYSSWLEWKNDEEQKTAQVNVEIELPYDVDNETLLDEAFKTSTKIAYTLEAVQGNASVEDNVSAWYQSDYLTYAKYSEGDLVGGEVSAQSDHKSDITDVIIPSYAYADDYYLPVTKIADNAFNACKGLTSITIPSSVTNIGSYAFYGCTGLTSITIPDSVTNIGEDAFEDCTGLTSITIPSSVTNIGSYAFYRCTGLTSITIPDKVTSIEGYVFSGCTGLTSITIPDNVTSIGEYAFSGSGLTSVKIPDSITEIEVSAFERCTDLTDVTIGSSLKSIENSLFGYCTGLTSITIPSSVESIGENAFDGCIGLTSVTIGSGVKSIKQVAFNNCSKLTSVRIPSSVTSIGWEAFQGCDDLKSVVFETTSGWQISKNESGSYSSITKDLTNAKTAAECLTTTYKDYFWERT